MVLCSGHENYVVIRELSLYPQSLLAKLTVVVVSAAQTLKNAMERATRTQPNAPHIGSGVLMRARFHSLQKLLSVFFATSDTSVFMLCKNAKSSTLRSGLCEG